MHKTKKKKNNTVVISSQFAIISHVLLDTNLRHGPRTENTSIASQHAMPAWRGGGGGVMFIACCIATSKARAYRDHSSSDVCSLNVFTESLPSNGVYISQYHLTVVTIGF
jgi:hypothetical protein